MTDLPALLVSIVLAAISLTIPGFALVTRAFVSTAKYLKYLFSIRKCAPSVFGPLLLVGTFALCVVGLSRAYHSVRKRIAPHPMLHATFIFSLWVVRMIITHTGLFAPVFAGSRILGGCWHKTIERMDKLRPCVLGHIKRLLVGSCSRFVSTLWPCLFSHAMSCLVVFGFDVRMSSRIWPNVSNYPLTFFVGLLILVVLWRSVFKALILGGLGVHILAYAYLVIVSRLARILLSLKLGHWIVLGPLLKYMFDANETSQRFIRQSYEVHCPGLYAARGYLAPTALQSALFGSKRLLPMRASTDSTDCQIFVRLVFKDVLVPGVRLLIFKILGWTCAICTVGCAVTGKIAVKLFAALLVPVLDVSLLVYRQFKSSQEVASVSQPSIPTVEHCDQTPISSEGFPSAPPSPASSSHSTTSEGVRRLGRLINAYLDDSVPTGSIAELEGQFENTPSMHSPRPVQTIPPPTPCFSPLATLILASPALPPVSPTDLALTPDLTSDVSYESADEDEEVLALATQLSGFHIGFESGSAPRQSKRVSRLVRAQV
ncbi:hypothetical protein RhiJN_22681 [Ceratobasidium sp. AG-Ba]|nr:hypothetical protein RhiJN_22681 [Ceratobasidium sp. AG-Ba]